MLGVRLAATVILFTGCAPLASFRPASGLMPGRKLEVGGGAVLLGSRPYVEEPSRGAGQVWATGDASRSVSLTLLGAFDAEAVALGGALRLNALETDRLAAGVEVELGYAWAGISLPFAVRAVDETWLYSAPRVGSWGMDFLLSAPVGVSVRVVDGLMLRAEGQASWQGARHFNRRMHLGAAAAYQR
jgi:hypothetical protein